MAFLLLNFLQPLGHAITRPHAGNTANQRHDDSPNGYQIATPHRRYYPSDAGSEEKSNPYEFLAHISAARHQQHTGKAWLSAMEEYAIKVLNSIPKTSMAASPTQGNLVSSSDFDGAAAVLVVFICPHCPFVQQIRHKLARFGRNFGQGGWRGLFKSGARAMSI
jgi:hypothetical protein